MSIPKILLNFFILFVTLSVTKLSATEIEECNKSIINGSVSVFKEIFADLNEMRETLNELKSSAEECSNTKDTSPKQFFDIRCDALPRACVNEIQPKNCAEATACTRRSGIYKILATQHNNGTFYVECDAETDGGGWIVIQSREDGFIDFYRNWEDYEKGFGDVDGEKFIGLKNLYTLTNFQGRQELLIIMENAKNERAFAKYNGFSIGDETELYKLRKLGNFTGTAGDSLREHLGMKFSTKDRDNDIDSRNCAETYTGAWWYKSCHKSNLNGKYGDNSHGKGLNWYDFTGHVASLKYVKMMIRRRQIYS